MRLPATQNFEANLRRLPAATREALQTDGIDDVLVDTNGPGRRPSVLTEDGRRVPVHTSDDPLTASQAIVAKLSEQGAPSLLIVIGLGLGYLLDALEQTNLSTRVLALEPLPGVTRAMLARRDWAHWLDNGRLTLLAGPAYAGAAEAWQLFDEPSAKPGVIMAPLIAREFSSRAAHAKDVVRRIIAGVRANGEARRQFAGRYLLNTISNLPVIASEGDVAALTGAFKGVPAVIVGAGPSLDRNLGLLSALEDRTVLIAVDTALKPLLAAGIRPHLVMAVDPSEANARHLTDLGDTRGVSMVAEGSIEPEVLTAFAGRTFTFRVSDHEPWPWVAAHGADRGQLRAWGSVLTTAFDLAVAAGCDPIVFAGADLAYSGGLQYCRNTAYEKEWRDLPADADRIALLERTLAEDPHPVETDVDGHEVHTTSHYIQFRDWILSRASEANDRTVINATGAGILHGGSIRQASPAELSPSWLRAAEPVDIHQRLEAAWARGAGARSETASALIHALSSPDSLPIDAWFSFGGDTAPPHRIAAAAEGACHQLHARTRARTRA